MSDNTQNLLIVCGGFFLTMSILGFSASRAETMFSKDEVFQRMAEQDYTANAERYNAGYRAGKMDILAELVECDKIQDPKVMEAYLFTSELLNEKGELDSTPYPCTE